MKKLIYLKAVCLFLSISFNSGVVKSQDLIADELLVNEGDVLLSSAMGIPGEIVFRNQSVLGNLGRIWTGTTMGGSNLGTMYLSTGSTTPSLTLAPDGLVGIGTSSPKDYLHIQSNDDTYLNLETLKTTVEAAAGILFTGNVGGTNYNSSIKMDGNGLHYTSGRDGYANHLFKDNHGGTQMIIKDNGRIGINTASPAYKLHLKESKSSWASYFDNNGSIVKLAHGNGYGMQIYPGINGNADSKYALLVKGKSNSKALYVSALNGYVGINNNAPTYNLHVIGEMKIDGDNAGLHIEAGTNDWLLGRAGSDFILKNNEDRMRIDNTGKTTFHLNSSRNISFTSHVISGKNYMEIQSHNVGNTGPEPMSFSATEFMFVGGDITCEGSLQIVEFKAKDATIENLSIPIENAADYVFEDDYELRTLEEVDAFVKENKHLPGVPSAKEMSEGVNVAELNNLLLEKVEELTLYMIELEKKNKELEQKVNQLMGE